MKSNLGLKQAVMGLYHAESLKQFSCTEATEKWHVLCALIQLFFIENKSAHNAVDVFMPQAQEMKSTDNLYY